MKFVLILALCTPFIFADDRADLVDSLKVLGLPGRLPVSFKQVQKHYKAEMRKNHADKNRDADAVDRSKEVSAAFDTIKEIKESIEHVPFNYASPSSMGISFKYDGKELTAIPKESYFTDAVSTVKFNDIQHFKSESAIYVNFPIFPELKRLESTYSPCTQDDSGFAFSKFNYTALKTCATVQLNGVKLVYLITKEQVASGLSSVYNSRNMHMLHSYPLVSNGYSYLPIINDMNFHYRMNDNLDLFVLVNDEKFFRKNQIQIAKSQKIDFKRATKMEKDEMLIEIEDMFLKPLYSKGDDDADVLSRKDLGNFQVFKVSGGGFKTRVGRSDVYLLMDDSLLNLEDDDNDNDVPLTNENGSTNGNGNGNANPTGRSNPSSNSDTGSDADTGSDDDPSSFTNPYEEYFDPTGSASKVSASYLVLLVLSLLLI